MACTGIENDQYISAANAQGDFEVETAKTNCKNKTETKSYVLRKSYMILFLYSS